MAMLHGLIMLIQWITLPQRLILKMIGSLQFV